MAEGRPFFAVSRKATNQCHSKWGSDFLCHHRLAPPDFRPIHRQNIFTGRSSRRIRRTIDLASINWAVLGLTASSINGPPTTWALSCSVVSALHACRWHRPRFIAPALRHWLRLERMAKASLSHARYVPTMGNRLNFLASTVLHHLIPRYSTTSKLDHLLYSSAFTFGFFLSIGT